MNDRAKDIGRLHEAARRCRAEAETADGGLAALSYAQLADEIDGLIRARNSARAAAKDVNDAVTEDSPA